MMTKKGLPKGSLLLETEEFGEDEIKNDIEKSKKSLAVFSGIFCLASSIVATVGILLIPSVLERMNKWACGEEIALILGVWYLLLLISTIVFCCFMDVYDRESKRLIDDYKFIMQGFFTDENRFDFSNAKLFMLEKLVRKYKPFDVKKSEKNHARASSVIVLIVLPLLSLLVEHSSPFLNEILKAVGAEAAKEYFYALCIAYAIVCMSMAYWGIYSQLKSTNIHNRITQAYNFALSELNSRWKNEDGPKEVNSGWRISVEKRYR